MKKIFNRVPRVRYAIKIIERNYDRVKIKVAFWGRNFIYAVILKKYESGVTLLSDQVINGYNENNTNVITQHYVNVTSSRNGVAEIEFKLLDDDADY